MTFFSKLKMAADAILEFYVMWIWLFWRVDSVVYVLGTKFGSNTCYSHWDRRTYASDVHLMTSRELTSGFDFHVAISARPWCIFPQNLVQISLSNPKLLTFSEIEDGGCRHLGFGWRSHGTTHVGAFVVRTPCKKFRHDRLSSFQVIRIWIFCRSGLKVLFTTQKFQFLGVYPQRLGAHRSDPQKALPCVISRLLSYRT